MAAQDLLQWRSSVVESLRILLPESVGMFCIDKRKYNPNGFRVSAVL